MPNVGRAGDKKRAPAVPRPLTPQEQQDPEVEADSSVLLPEERACAHLCTEFGKEQAASRLGWSMAKVEETLDLPRVRRYLQKANDAFLAELGKAKVRAMSRVGISRATIEERLMTLANMDPSETKGNIDGQVKALRTLAEVMGYASDPDPLSGKTPEELKAIVKKAHLQIEGTVPLAKSVN